MKLSAEQFAELAASFKTQPSTTTHERRRAARLDLNAQIRIRPVDEADTLTACYVNVSNFSARGISFVHNIQLETGAQFITELPRKNGGQVELLCTVAHVEPAGPNSFRIGAEFTCVIPTRAPANNSNDELSRIKAKMLG